MGNESPNPEKFVSKSIKRKWTTMFKNKVNCNRVIAEMQELYDNIYFHNTESYDCKFITIVDKMNQVVCSTLFFFTVKETVSSVIKALSYKFGREFISHRLNLGLRIKPIEPERMIFNVQGNTVGMVPKRPIEFKSVSIRQADLAFNHCKKLMLVEPVRLDNVCYERVVVLDFKGSNAHFFSQVCTRFPNCGLGEELVCSMCCKMRYLTKICYVYGRIPKIVLYYTDKYRVNPFEQNVDVSFPSIIVRNYLELMHIFHCEMGIFPKLDVSDRVYEAYEDMSEKMEQLLNTFKTSNLLEKATTAYDFLFDKKKILILPCSLVLVYNALNFYRDGGYVNASLTVVSSIMLKCVLPDNLCGFLNKFISRQKLEKEQFVSQFGNLGQEDLFSWFIEVVTFLIVGNELSGSVNSKTKINLIAALPKFVEGMKFTGTSIIKLLDPIIEYIKVHVLGLDVDERDLQGIEEFDVWNAECKRIIELHNMQQLTMDMDGFEHVLKLRVMGEQFIMKFKTKETQDLKTYIITMLKNIARIQTAYNSYNLFSTGCRMVPLTVLFMGLPGSGKSNMLQPLCMELLDRCIPLTMRNIFEKNPELLWHIRQSENVFWDGYTRLSFLTLFDDFGQMKDIAGSPDNEIMNMIRCSNCFPAHLHMSEIDKKCNTLFNSKIILANTNMKKFITSSIWCTEALNRRFHHTFFVAPPPQYSKNPDQNFEYRRLDQSKCEGPVDFNAMEFHEYNLLTETYTNNVYTYSEVVELLVGTFDKLKNVYEEKQAFINDRVMVTQNGSLDEVDIFNTDNPIEESLISKLDRLIAEGDVNLDKIFILIEAFLENNKSLLPNLQVEHIFDQFPKTIGKLMEQKANPDFEIFLKRFGELLEHNKYEIKNGLKPQVQISYVDYCKDKIIDIKNKIKAKFSKYPLLGIITAVSTIVGLSLMSYKAFAPEQSKNRLVLVNESISEDGRKEKRWYKFNKSKYNDKYVKPVIEDPNQMKLEGGYDDNMENIISKVAKRNHYCIKNGSSIVGYMTFIRGRIAIMPLHYISIFEEYGDLQLDFVKVDCDKKFTFSTYSLLDCKRVEVKDSDYVAILLPSIFPVHADVSKFFVSEKYYNSLNKANVILDIRDVEKGRRFMSLSTIVHNIPQVNETTDETTILGTAVKYNAVTRKGDCGSLLYLNDSGSGNQKIVGMHVAGNGVHVCLSNVITLELLEETIKNFPGELTRDLTSFDIQSGECLPGFVSLSRTNLASKMSIKSRLTKSPCYNAWGEAKTKPAHLTPFVNSNGDRVNPMEKARSKYIADVKYIEESVVDACMDDVFREIVNSMEEVGIRHKRILTFEEAILGIPGEQYFEAIPRSTSAGYPYCETTTKGKKGKEAFFGNGESYDLENSECLALKKDVEKLVNEARQGIVSDVIYKDFLKDERRTIGKVDDGKTRLVSGAPVHYVIAFRMFFMAFIANFMRAKIHSGSAVGINPYGEEWNELVKFLKTVGDKVAAGDYKSFDGKNHPQINSKATDYINRWYNDGEENAKIRHALMANLSTSIHVFFNLIYIWLSSLPSGHPFTTTMNTITNMFLFRLAWVLVHDKNVSSLIHFKEMVKLACYGDDNVASIRLVALERFNQITISKALLEYGFEYTDETKTDGAMVPYRNLEDVTFLKRGFVFNDYLKQYVAPLDRQVVMEIPYWVRSKVGKIDQMYCNIDQLTYEMSLHGQEAYDEAIERVKSFFNTSENPAPHFKNWLLRFKEVRELDNFLDQ